MAHMDQSLLKSSRNNEHYDPFASPPDLQKAQDHGKAFAVGKDKDDDEDSVQICPCCENVI